MAIQRCLRWGAVLLGMALVLPMAWPADSAVATALLESGKKALNAKKSDEAASMFRKALAEDPSLLEAAYWLGAAEEKIGDETAALADYRQFLARMDKKGGGATPEELKLRPLAEKRVDALAAWEKEYLKVEEKYVSELLALAKDRSEKEPWVAIRALDLVLAVRPRHPAALAMKEMIGGKGDGRTGAEIFPEVKEWRDLVAGQEFKPVDGLLTYTGNTLTVDVHGKKYGVPRKPVTTGPCYAYEIEFRILEIYEDDWHVGLVMGNANGIHCDLVLEKARVVLQSVVTGATYRDLESTPVAPSEIGTWRRLSVGVRGDTVQVWLDGKRILEERITERADLAGDLGVKMALCKSEWRVLRTGSL